MQRYEKYKDSGVDWIGEIPEHWEIRKLKNCLKTKLKYGANESGVEYDAELPRYIRITDFGFDGKLSEDKKLSLTWKQGLGYLLNDGDILFARSGATVGKSYQFKATMSFEKYYAFAGYLIKAESNESIVKSDFLYLFTNSNSFDNWKSTIFNKATIENIGADKYSELRVIIPPISEQNLIINFLNDKTAKIDQTIAIKQKEIELLQERQQILIQKAVTKGLDNTVKLKDSGVDWIGEISEHWEIAKNKILFKERKKAGEENLPLLSVSIHTGISDNELSDEDNIRGKIKIEDKSNYKLVFKNDIVYNMMRAWQGAIGSVMVRGLVSPAYVVATPNAKIFSKFFEYQYRTPNLIEQMNKYSKGITDFRKRLYWEEFKQILTIVPPIDEQTQIVTYIEELDEKIAKAILLKQQEIEKLKEYKTVLVDNVVTGKVRVSY